MGEGYILRYCVFEDTPVSFAAVGVSLYLSTFYAGTHQSPPDRAKILTRMKAMARLIERLLQVHTDAFSNNY